MSRFRGLSTIVILALVFGLGAAVADAQRLSDPPPSATGFPSLIEGERSPDRPLWIAADLLLDAFGKLRRDYLPPRVARLLEGKEDFIDEINDFGNLAPSDGIPCTVNRAVRGSTWGEPDVPRTLGELLRRSHFAVSGKVSAAVDGFWRSAPATMITILVTEVFKPAQQGELPRYVNVPIFAGEIALGSARICTSRSNWPTSPDVGDEVFLFPIRSFGPENTLTIDFPGYEIIFSSNGTLVFPGYLGRYLELDEFESGVRSDPRALSATLRALGGIR